MRFSFALAALVGAAVLFPVISNQPTTPAQGERPAISHQSGAER